MTGAVGRGRAVGTATSQAGLDGTATTQAGRVGTMTTLDPADLGSRTPGSANPRTVRLNSGCEPPLGGSHPPIFLGQAEVTPSAA